ncbi:MAG TPA: type VI secretion system tube protein Hcp, partial [Phenylobacterium sp.]|nr:type VI secretion system tube protein Hcp [Phenylobacterium sp.]
PLMQACAQGTHFPTAKFVVRKAGDKPLEYLVYEIEDMIVTSVSTGGSGGEDRLTETISINFAQIKMKYVEQLETGDAGGDSGFGYNMKKNEPVAP